MKAVEETVMVESRLMSGCLRGVAKVDGLVGGLLGVAKMSICWFLAAPFADGALSLVVRRSLGAAVGRFWFCWTSTMSWDGPIPLELLLELSVRC